MAWKYNLPSVGFKSSIQKKKMIQKKWITVSEDGNDKQLFTNKLPLCKPLMERRRCSLFVSQSVSGARDNRILSVLLNRTSQGSHPCQRVVSFIFIHSVKKGDFVTKWSCASRMWTKELASNFNICTISRQRISHVLIISVCCVSREQ